MSFYGSHFSFDGIPSFEYGLMVYDVGNASESGAFSSPVKISEDRTAWRYKPLHYGATQNTPLEFTLTFGADTDAIDMNEHLDRIDMSVIASWLTGHDQYKWLEITQPDMETVRYLCIVSGLKYVSYGNMPWAFQCQVICDSPFAYTYPQTFSYSANGIFSALLESRQSCKHYYPTISISITRGTSFTIINHSDGDRTLSFNNMPSSSVTLTIDNENEVITSSSGLDYYKYVDFAGGSRFFRLVKGRNNIEIVGVGTVSIECEFPIDIGG